MRRLVLLSVGVASEHAVSFYLTKRTRWKVWHWSLKAHWKSCCGCIAVDFGQDLLSRVVRSVSEGSRFAKKCLTKKSWSENRSNEATWPLQGRPVGGKKCPEAKFIDVPATSLTCPSGSVSATGMLFETDEARRTGQTNCKKAIFRWFYSMFLIWPDQTDKACNSCGT